MHALFLRRRSNQAPRAPVAPLRSLSTCVSCEPSYAPTPILSMDKFKIRCACRTWLYKPQNHLSDGRYDQEVLLSSMRSRAVLRKAPPPMRAILPAPPPAAPPECSVPVSVDSDGNRARSFGGVANQAIGKEKKIPTGPKSARFARPETKGHSEDGYGCAPAPQRFEPTRQTPLKTGEIPPRSGNLNGFATGMMAEGTGTGIARSLPCKLLLLFTPRGWFERKPPQMRPGSTRT